MMKLINILTALLLLCEFSFSQTALYEWQDHLPYSSGRKIAITEDAVFCLTSGGLFSYQNSSGAIERHTKISGLTEINFSTIHYCPQLKTLLIGYEDGNIDLIIDKEIYNISDIKRKQIIGLKSVNSATFYNNLAYLACGFGIIVLDTERKEIKETYYIGDEGDQINVNDIAFVGDYIVATTENGIYRADVNSLNLIDFNQWEQLSFLPGYSENFTEIESFNGKVYACYNPLNDSINDQIYIIDNNSYTQFSLATFSTVNRIRNNNNELLISVNDKVIVIDEQEKIAEILDNYVSNPKPYDANKDENDKLWIADGNQGLIEVINSSQNKTYQPDGPRTKEVWDIEVADNKVWITAGGPNDMWNHLGASHYDGTKWKDHNVSYIVNFSKVKPNPLNSSQVYYGSHSMGLAEFNNNYLTKLYDQSNSVLENVAGYSSYYILVTGLDFDKDNNLWISTTLADKPVYVKSPGEEIQQLQFDYAGFNALERVGEIMVTEDDNKWLIIERHGLFVFRTNGQTVTDEKFFQIKNREGNIISTIIFSIAEDLDGNVWIGTEKGPVVFYNPEDVFDETLYGNQVLIPRNDGSGFADPLLETETINCIAIDGANRKWFGTANSGAFLISEDGSKELKNFNVDNSPIFSNNITDIGINHETGEVYFGSDKGLISYRDAATESNEEFGDVYVFPNPVREDFHGDVVIAGLIDNTIVKITDISGNLVYETTSLGSQAVWNGKNFNGQRVKTGVYLVFLSNSDGSKTHITKLLFIN